MQRNDMEEKAEFLADENERLRRLAGEQHNDDSFEDWRRRRASKLAQMAALNAELERMVAELEEGRHRDGEARRLCARYHGKCDYP
jgi:hypothetical protein